MRPPTKLIACTALAVALGALVAAGAGARQRATPLVSIGAGLKGPAGLQASVYATGLTHVSAFAFDAKGRLWVTTSAATGHSADGVFLVRAAGATPVKVISGLQGPLGLVWHAGTLYVASIGRVDAYRTLRGSRFAVHRTILTEPGGHGWNQDIVLAPDGRLIMSIASACDHCTTTSRYSASIISFDLDGSHVETYASRVRAAFGLAFYPGTSTLFASMNQRDDLGAKTPGDALAIVRAGEDWRFPGCYQQGGPACSGVPSTIATLDKHAAAGGVAFASGGLGTTIGTAALVSEWEFGKVLAVRLSAHGSGYAGSAPTTVLTGFRSPLPLITTASKALLVGDWATGKIYRIAASA
jgi:glucose/arabinose dehydrogenase